MQSQLSSDGEAELNAVVAAVREGRAGSLKAVVWVTKGDLIKITVADTPDTTLKKLGFKLIAGHTYRKHYHCPTCFEDLLNKLTRALA